MPTEELFGAYHFLLEVSDTSAKTRFTNKLRASGVNLSPQGLDQVLKAEVVTNQQDRNALAKLVGQSAGPILNARPIAKR